VGGQLSQGHLQAITVYDKIGDAVLVQDRVLQVLQPLEQQGGQDPDVRLRVQAVPGRQLVVQGRLVLVQQQDVGAGETK